MACLWAVSIYKFYCQFLSMYIIPRGRYHSGIQSWERIIHFSQEPVDFYQGKIKPGQTVDFTYRPWLTFDEREYRCRVLSVSERSMKCEILRECPIPFRWGTGKPTRRFYFGKSMKMYRIISPPTVSPDSPQVTQQQDSSPRKIIREGQPHIVTDTGSGYRDEHGCYR